MPNQPFETDLRKRASPACLAAQWRRFAIPRGLMASTVRTSWVAYVCVGLLVGCASQAGTVAPRQPASPVASAPQIGEALARLYVFNISGWTLIPSNQDIIDNGKLLASLPRLTYTIVPIPPGVHDLQLHGRKLALIAEAGRTHFVVAGYRPERSWAFPLAGDPVVIRQISEEEARPLLQELKPQ